jgi:hypothetical protein
MSRDRLDYITDLLRGPPPPPPIPWGMIAIVVIVSFSIAGILLYFAA